MANLNMVGDVTTAALESGLRGLSARQLAITDNLANIETPGYKAAKISFEEQLRETIDAANAGAAPRTQRALPVASVDPIEQRDTTSWRRDGNNVNLEEEMTSAAETSLRYKMTAKILAKKLRIIRAAINTGGAS